MKRAFSLCVLIGCAAGSNKMTLKLETGKSVDEIEYTSFETLEKELQKKELDEIDFKTERSLLPKGGRLYVLEKVFNVKDPVIYAIVSDNKHSFKCEDSEVSNTLLKPAGYDPTNVFLNAVGAKYDKTKTEIQCDIKTPLTMPIRIQLMNANKDTVSVYHVGSR